MTRAWMYGVALLAGLGCDDGDGDGPNSMRDGGADAAGDMQSMGDATPPINDCSGAFVVSAIASEGAPCADLRVGDRVSLQAGRLSLGDLDLVVTAADAACRVEATGCTVDPVPGDRSVQAAVLDVAQGTLTLSTAKAEAFRAVECGPMVLSLVPTGDCALDGQFEVAAAPMLTGGACDLTWDAEPVFIDTQSLERTLVWGDETYAITAVNPDTCTVVAQTEFSIFNGVARTTRIEAQVVGERVEFTIQDALEGTSDFGETCVDARFTATGAATGPGAPLPPQCESLPFVCGDGVCGSDGGEQCENCPEDCGCGDGDCTRLSGLGTEEAPVVVCSAPCGGQVTCGADQRCVPAEEFGAFFVEETPGSSLVTRVCLDALPDETGLGGDCTDSRACAAGLMCATNILPGGRCLPPLDTVDPADCREVWALNQFIDLCHPRCGRGVDACGATSTCSTLNFNSTCSTEDRERFYCHPTELLYECRPDALGFGEPCASRGYCAQAGDDVAGCIGDQCALADGSIDCTVSLCSRPCETDDDCAAPLSTCSVIDNRGVSKWCITP